MEKSSEIVRITMDLDTVSNFHHSIYARKSWPLIYVSFLELFIFYAVQGM